MPKGHTGHRQRVKSRYVAEGFDHFKDHEVLEAALFLANKRGNTNETAHLLLEEFGSVKGVLEADYDMLIRVNGVGECTAFSLKVMLEMLKRYERGLHENPTRYTRISQIGMYFYNQYIYIS